MGVIETPSEPWQPAQVAALDLPAAGSPSARAFPPASAKHNAIVKVVFVIITSVVYDFFA
ncbi:hypothetical protein GCM10007392_24950 [Saccharospirillum salsuginis]|uniref:Uncharacterized protein n=1 Tax=Saccharospirillum salsuginis TaxID=418750 RepID=A0A918K9Q1_9GAMM|nr:hypothetical protein GCM10007392_24950 [Saccharospirillum salsuginis]